MARLSLSLLGPLQMTLDGHPVTDFRYDKVRALLAFLAGEADRPILTVADAAASVEAETFELAALERVGKREDEVGRLAQVFQRMAREVQEREQRLQQRVQELRVEIDEIKRTKQVDEIVHSDFFSDLQSKANDMRRRRQQGLGS